MSYECHSSATNLYTHNDETYSDEDLEFIEEGESLNTKTQGIDWEQRRYEIAKELYSLCIDRMIEPAKGAIELADDLIRELKKENNENE